MYVCLYMDHCVIYLFIYISEILIQKENMKNISTNL